jgi:hypothetical protein
MRLLQQPIQRAAVKKIIRSQTKIEQLDSTFNSWTRKVAKPLKISQVLYHTEMCGQDSYGPRGHKKVASLSKFENLMSSAHLPLPSRLNISSTVSESRIIGLSVSDLRPATLLKSQIGRFREKRDTFLMKSSRADSVPSLAIKLTNPHKSKAHKPQSLSEVPDSSGSTPLLMCKAILSSAPRSSMSRLGAANVPPSTIDTDNAQVKEGSRSPRGISLTIRPNYSSLAIGQFWSRKLRQVTEEIKGVSGTRILERAESQQKLQTNQSPKKKQKLTDRKALQEIVKNFYRERLKAEQTNRVENSVSRGPTAIRTEVRRDQGEQRAKVQLSITSRRYKRQATDPEHQIPSPVLERLRNEPKYLMLKTRISRVHQLAISRKSPFSSQQRKLTLESVPTEGKQFSTWQPGKLQFSISGKKFSNEDS